MNTKVELGPQAGPQTAFLKSRADLCVYGGSAGSGKSYALLLDPLYDTGNSKFAAVIFRRTCSQLCNPGGLWPTSETIYPFLGAKPYSQSLEWAFPSGAVVKFSHLEHPKDRFSWQGSELAFIGFDELCQFTENQFWYLLSRNRSMSGVKGRVRATCNADSDSFVRQLIDWWIDNDSGLSIPERSGVLRWFVRIGDTLSWADSREEIIRQFGADAEPKSLSFIPAKVHDNQLLLARDPSYLSSLKALPSLDRRRLLEGDWNARPEGGDFFQRSWFEIIDRPPGDVVSRVRFWDRAASPLRSGTSPDATVGVLMSKTSDGLYIIEDCKKLFASPFAVERAMLENAQADGHGVLIGWCQDPGSAGVSESEHASRLLDGYNFRFSTVTGSKDVRARPLSAQCEARRVKLVRGSWNNDFINELQSFPEGRHDDAVDAAVGSYELLNSGRVILVA